MSEVQTVEHNVSYLGSNMSSLQSTLGGTKVSGGSIGMSSSAKVPNKEPDIINSLISACNSLSSKFGKEISAINSVGDGFVSMDNLLKDNTGKLDFEINSKLVDKVELKSYSSSSLDAILEEYEKLNKELIANYAGNIDLDKYKQNPSIGFELWISKLRYSLVDFSNSQLRGKYGYTAEQALEAFIGVIIAESDKSLDDTLGVTTVALNRCQNSNWNSYYQNGTNPFDQMFANNGSQYSTIRHPSSSNSSVKAYEAYMPSVVGIDKVNKALAAYGTDYDTLKGVVMDALEGGVRNNFYTGFRSNGYNGWSEVHISPKGNKYQFENYNKDTAIMNGIKVSLVSTSLSGTSYKSNGKVLVQKGAELGPAGLGDIIKIDDTSSSTTDETIPNPTDTTTGKITDTSTPPVTSTPPSSGPTVTPPSDSTPPRVDPVDTPVTPTTPVTEPTVVITDPVIETTPPEDETIVLTEPETEPIIIETEPVIETTPQEDEIIVPTSPVEVITEPVTIPVETPTPVKSEDKPTYTPGPSYTPSPSYYEEPKVTEPTTGPEPYIEPIIDDNETIQIDDYNESLPEEVVIDNIIDDGRDSENVIIEDSEPQKSDNSKLVLGAILAAGTVAGAGIYAYKKYNEDDDEEDDEK